TPTCSATSAPGSPAPTSNSALRGRIRRLWPRCTAACHSRRSCLTVGPQKCTVLSTGYLLAQRFSLPVLRLRYPVPFVTLRLILFLMVYSTLRAVQWRHAHVRGVPPWGGTAPSGRTPGNHARPAPPVPHGSAAEPGAGGA